MMIAHNEMKQVNLKGLSFSLYGIFQGINEKKPHNGFFHWEITISTENGKETFDYFIGPANQIGGNCFGLLSFLECIAHDAQAGAMNFRYFLTEYGYSHKEGKPIWETCRENGKKLENLFDSDYEDFLDAFDDHLFINGLEIEKVKIS